jgi:hypothetical protein
MRNILFILSAFLIYFSIGCAGPSRLQRRMSLPSFDPRSDYRRTAPKVNPAFKGIPIMETFKTNYDMEIMQLDYVSDRKFIQDSLWSRVNSLYKQQPRSREGKKPFEILILRSGARIIFPTDPKDKRIFISVYPGYYFVIRGSIIWTSCYVDDNGKVLGSLDPTEIVHNPIRYIKYHLSSGLISGK